MSQEKPVKPNLTTGQFIACMCCLAILVGVVAAAGNLIMPAINGNRVDFTNLTIALGLIVVSLLILGILSIPWFIRRRVFTPALNLARNGDFAAAHEMFLEAYRRWPNAADTWAMLALSYIIQCRLTTALECAQKAVELRHDYCPLAFRGLALSAIGADAEARVEIEAALSLLRMRHARSILGATLVRLRLLDTAIPVLEKNASRKDLLSLSTLAGAYAVAGREEDANAIHRIIVERNWPSDIHFRPQVANAMVSLGKMNEAAQIAESVLADAPGLSDALLVLFRVRALSGDTEEALRIGTAIAIKDPAGLYATLCDAPSTFFDDGRVRELFVACQRTVKAQTTWAGLIIGPQEPPAMGQAPQHSTPDPTHWPTPEETWGPA